MRMSVRATEASDLGACAAINADRYLYNDDATGRLVRLWGELLASRCAQSSVIEDEQRAAADRIVGFGFSMFLSEKFVEELKRKPSPYVARQVLDRWSQGRSPLLAFEDVRRANAGQGLIVLGSHYGMADGLTADEAANMASYMAQAFVTIHRGLRVKEFLIEAFGPFALSRLLATGSKLLTDHANFFRARSMDSPPLDRCPYLTSSKLEDTLGVEGSPFGLVFRSYAPPRFHFSPLEQDLLLRALGGQTDEQLAHALNLAVITVKKRWDSIYTRVATVLPGLLPSFRVGHGMGSRGAEKRRHLLNYLREHPEELRPYLS
jgi:hypothetical protein